MKIGTLAKAAGLSVDTLRFYERRGLLPPPGRLATYRAYTPQALERLRFIRDARALGFTLAEIGELLSLPTVPRAACEALRQRCERKREEIEGRIRELRNMRRLLDRLLADCSDAAACTGVAALNRAAPAGRRALAAPRADSIPAPLQTARRRRAALQRKDQR